MISLKTLIKLTEQQLTSIPVSREEKYYYCTDSKNIYSENKSKRIPITYTFFQSEAERHEYKGKTVGYFYVNESNSLYWKTEEWILVSENKKQEKSSMTSCLDNKDNNNYIIFADSFKLNVCNGDSELGTFIINPASSVLKKSSDSTITEAVSVAQMGKMIFNGNYYYQDSTGKEHILLDDDGNVDFWDTSDGIGGEAEGVV